jgi:hypothetical protein
MAERQVLDYNLTVDFLRWRITSAAAFWRQIHGMLSAEEYEDTEEVEMNMMQADDD